MASRVVYPAHVTMPDRALEDALAIQLRVAMGISRTRRAPHSILAGFGLLSQVPGCPRCPSTYARSVAALAAARQGA